MDYDNDRNNTFFRFEDLRIYHKAMGYTRWVNEATGPHMNSHGNGILERFNTASHNIVLNIAEGSARNKSQFIYYLKMAKSAVRECLVVTSIIHNMGIFDDTEETESRNQLMEMTKMIGALITSLQRSNQNRRGDDDDDDDYNNDMGM